MSKICKDKKYHYFYKITNNINLHFYYGIHSTDDINDGYMSSSTILHNYAFIKYGYENFNKEILKFFNNREDALKYEASIVNEDMIKNPECYNIAIGGKAFATNTVIVYDPILNKNIMISNKDPRYINGELKKFDTGYILVKDTDGNCFKIKKDDIRFLSGELHGISYGISKSIKLRLKLSIITNTNIVNGKHNLINTCYVYKYDENNNKQCKRINDNELTNYLLNGWERSKNLKNCPDMRWIHKGNEEKLVNRNDIKFYIEDGWERGHNNINKSFNKGEFNPNYGKHQKLIYKINEDGTYTNKLVNIEKINEYLLNGWILGHKYNKK